MCYLSINHGLFLQMAITAADTIIAVDFTKIASGEAVETLVVEAVVEVVAVEGVAVEGVVVEKTLEAIGTGATKVTKETRIKLILMEIKGVDITIDMTIVEVITINKNK